MDGLKVQIRRQHRPPTSRAYIHIGISYTSQFLISYLILKCLKPTIHNNFVTFSITFDD